MSENRQKEISVDEIMTKIREEVARRKFIALGQDSRDHIVSQVSEDNGAIPQISMSNVMSNNTQETKLFRLIKKIEQLLKKYPFYNFVFTIAIKYEKYIPKYKKRQLTMIDLLKFHDEEFIRNAYKTILKREPDNDGYHNYLSMLRSGSFSKTEILGMLRYSSEGKQTGVKITGLSFSCFIQSIYKIPVLGCMFRYFVAIIGIPKIFRHIQEYEAATNARFTQYLYQLNDATTNLNTQIEQISTLLTTNLNTQIEQISTLLTTKADVHIVDGIKNTLSDHKMIILDQQRSLTLLLEEVRKRLSKPMSEEQMVNMIKEEDHIFDAAYVIFENEFRGTRKDIKERLKIYLPYIGRIKTEVEAPVLDVGCGRGEWLELLRENNYTAKGVDLNRVMVQQCKDLGLDAIEADVIAYLRKQKGNSLRVITGFHIAEHLPLKTLIALFDESLRVIKPGGMVIFETPNPENLIVGSCNFYMDPTHRNPLPPTLLRFVAEQRGFAKTEILRLHKLKNIVPTGQEAIDEIVHRYNMEQDYSLIGYKV